MPAPEGPTRRDHLAQNGSWSIDVGEHWLTAPGRVRRNSTCSNVIAPMPAGSGGDHVRVANLGKRVDHGEQPIPPVAPHAAATPTGLQIATAPATMNGVQEERRQIAWGESGRRSARDLRATRPLRSRHVAGRVIAVENTQPRAYELLERLLERILDSACDTASPRAPRARMPADHRDRADRLLDLPRDVRPGEAYLAPCATSPGSCATEHHGRQHDRQHDRRASAA